MIPKDFSGLYDRLSYTHGREDVFRDFLDVSLFMLSGGTYREDYDRLSISYKENEMEIFIQMLHSVAIHSEGFNDVLGDVFMEHISHGHHGQFFTPIHISDLMAVASGCETLRRGQSVYDPCCGSGRMLLSAVKASTKSDISNRPFYYGSDIDLNCVKMAAVNLLMNTIPGEVAWMDALTLEHWRSYKVELVSVCGVWLPLLSVCGAGDTSLITRIQNTPQMKTAKGMGQLQLSFDF